MPHQCWPAAALVQIWSATALPLRTAQWIVCHPHRQKMWVPILTDASLTSPRNMPPPQAGDPCHPYIAWSDRSLGCVTLRTIKSIPSTRSVKCVTLCVTRTTPWLLGDEIYISTLCVFWNFTVFAHQNTFTRSYLIFRFNLIMTLICSSPALHPNWLVFYCTSTSALLVLSYISNREAKTSR